MVLHFAITMIPLIYTNLCLQKNTKLTYDKQFFEALMDTFQSCANHSYGKILNGEDDEHNVCIVPARLCAILHIRDC